MHSLQLIQLTERGRNLLATRRKNVVFASGSAIVACGLAAYIQSRRKKPNSSGHCNEISDDKEQLDMVVRNDKASKQSLPAKKEGVLRAVIQILLSHMGLSGAVKLLALVAIAVLRTASGNRFARVQGNLYHAAFLRDKASFLRLIKENLMLGFILSILHSTTEYISGSLSVQFRKILTKLIHEEYFQNMAYYKVSHVDARIHNPEQRIASDVPRFCSQLTEFIPRNIMAIVDGVIYSWKLCSYSSPKYIVWMLAYILGSGAAIRRLSPAFGMLMAKEQQLLGDYRQLYSRLRTHAESIAFYGGEKTEESHIQKKFKTLIEHMNVVIHHNWWFSIAQDLFFRFLGGAFAGALMIEPFFLGKLRPESSTRGGAEMLSNMKYHSSVIISLLTSLGILFGNPLKIFQLRSLAGRIYELITVSRELSCNGPLLQQGNASTKFVSETNYIEFDSVKVVTPTGNVLVEDLTLKVESGTNLLITGPNGSGKSSLFRVLGGLWPLVSGHIAKPGVGSELNKEIFYVPQRPYMVVGLLRDQLIYPLTAGQEVEPLTHDQMVELLKYVDLEYLLDRYPLEKEIYWGDELSLGEQQRLGMARLFYHKPKFAILDECTSAVTSDMEKRFCTRVRAMGMSCITISHRPALVAFHDVVLSLDGEGGWSAHYKRDEYPGSNASELMEAARRSDAMAVQQAFANSKKDSSLSNAKSESYISELIASSPSLDHGAVVPALAHLRSAPRSLIVRTLAMFKVMVPTVFDKQGAQVLTVALLVGLTSLLSNASGLLQGNATKHVLAQDSSSFVKLFGAATLLNAASCVISPSLGYLTSKLALGWRIRLTQHLLKNYFRKEAYYKVINTSGTDVDADQRITQDLEKLTTDISGLVTGTVKPSVDMLWLTWRMQLLTGQKGVALLYAYMIVGLGLLRNFTPDFGYLASREQQLEGNFRFMHERLRTHAESIAFFGGGAREKTIAESRLWDLLDHSSLHIKKKWFFGILDDFITKQLPQSVAASFSLLYAMEYKGDQSLISNQGEFADGLRYITSVASASFSTFGEILQLQKKCSELSGGVNRIFELDEILNAAQSDDNVSASTLLTTRQRISNSNEMISFSEVDIVTPAHKMLAKKLTVQILPGKSLLVTGPNGSGKSCIFRVLRGLWPLVSGRVVKPCQRSGEEDGSGHGIFYVPQRPYMAIGTLRDQIIYPLFHKEAEQRIIELYGQGQTSVDAIKILDTHLRTILENVKLLYLLEREGWDASKNWEDVLSLGEQQRLGMARLFFHKPRFGVLDECTNATSIDVEDHLYKLAKDMGITFVTSSQRPALITYHSTELRLIDGEGKWELHSIKH